MLLVQLFGLPDQETILCVYVLSLAVVVVLYRTWARGKMRCVLRDFQDRMGLLAAFAFVSYYGLSLIHICCGKPAKKMVYWGKAY